MFGGRFMRREDIMGVFAAMVESEFNVTEGLEARAMVKVGDVAVGGANNRERWGMGGGAGESTQPGLGV